MLQLIAGPASQINVHGWPGERRPPRRQQERALQDKPISEWRLRQAIEEPLHDEVLEQFLERPPLRTRLVEQALPDRGAEVATTHSIASRYGRTTFSTRSTWANLDSA
jgi:hypothetical protein